MKFLKKMLGKLNGLHYPQEYLCLNLESFTEPLHAYLIQGSRVIQDITNLHSFVGYSPLVISLPSIPEPSAESSIIQIYFTREVYTPNAFFHRKDAVAMLTLKKIKEQQAGNEKIFYYEGVTGRHRFLSGFHQFIIQLGNRLYNKKPGNVFLPGNLYKQVQIAYSLPRNISLITVGHNNQFNLFPTDLHGPISELYYIISLRHEGKACRQVVKAGKILVSEVNSNFYETAYSLGKNHMQELKEKEYFPFSTEVSVNLRLPVPSSALTYRELELQDSFIYGIHRVMLFKTLSRQRILDTPSTLAHIHNVYATWRHNKGLAGNYLMR